MSFDVSGDRGLHIVLVAKFLGASVCHLSCQMRISRRVVMRVKILNAMNASPDVQVTSFATSFVTSFALSMLKIYFVGEVEIAKLKLRKLKLQKLKLSKLQDRLQESSHSQFASALVLSSFVAQV
jgi:hypothetical protein